MIHLHCLLNAAAPGPPAWATTLAALLTPTIAAFAVCIAWRQYATARDKLKLDLFDRRYAVYRGTVELFAAASDSSRAESVTAEDLANFSFTTHSRRFLFDDGLSAYLTTAFEKAQDLKHATAKLDRFEGDRDTPAFDQLFQRQYALQAWFYDELQSLAKKFEPYLGFKKLN